MRRVTAKRSDFSVLLPTGQTEQERYIRNQIRYFMSIAFNKNFDLGDERLIDYWTTTAVNNPQVPIIGNRTIQLQPCQLKLVTVNDDFENEQVIRVVRFAVPEVKIFPIDGSFIPWSFRLLHDVQLRTDTLYVSKNLRPFIKMPRGANFKLRFVEFRSRANDMNNMIFYNRLDSSTEIINFIQNIFENNVRTRLRRKDAI